MLVFAFGSNLDPDVMRERCPNHRVVGIASLADSRLAFPRYSEYWGGGVASPTLAHGHTVWGVVVDLTDADLASLDRHEGFVGPGDQHNLCDRETLTVDLTRAEDGSIPRRLRPMAYVARPYNPTPPSERYRDTMVRGARAHTLPEEYVAELAALETAPQGRAAG